MRKFSAFLEVIFILLGICIIVLIILALTH
jgi:hypothetical protein